MSSSTPSRYAWIVSLLIVIAAASAFFAPDAEAQSSYFSSRGCVSCHAAPTPATCNGCHRHGASGGLTTTTNKTTYAPGETVTVTLTASGSRTGWIRAILYRDNVEVARSTGTATGGMGGGAGYPITFNTPAPATAGTYSYVAAWFGNTANSGSTHGEVRSAARSITVSAPVPSDTTAPTVSSTTPTSSATNVALATAVTATFSEAVTGVSGTTFFLRAAGSATNVPATVSLNAAGTTATLQPSSALAGSTTYTATITTGVRDAAGNALAANRTWSFTTAAPPDTTRPTVSSTGPANTATNINPATAVTATFSEAVTGVSASTFFLRAAGSSTNVTATVTLNAAGTTATLQPTSALANSTTYTATATTGVRDAAGNTLASNFTWSFTTAAAADTTAPTVTGTNPATNAANVAPNVSVTATFSENILPASVTTSSFTVGGVAGTVSVSGATATFTPSAPLAYSTTYTATVTTAVTDLASNHLAANRTWSFTTSAAPDTAPPTVASTAPVSNATSVSVSSPVTATFSEAMRASTITTANFRLMQGATSVAGTVTLNAGGTTATFQPTAPLANNAVYTATVTTGVQDLAGNAMAANRSWSFTTAAAADTTAPSVVSVSPAANGSGIAVNSSVTATFSEAINPLTVTGATFTLRNGATPVSGAVSVNGGTATFQPGAPLANSTTYTATLTSGIQDPAGNALASSYSWSFTTGAAADTTPPTVTGTTPAGNATNVAIQTAITATFSEAVDASTVTTATFRLMESPAIASATATTGAVAVTGTVTVSGTTATFAPSALLPNTVYTATLTTGIKDAAGNAMAQERSWTFTTAQVVATPDDRDDDGADDEEDEWPDDDRKGSVREHRHGKKFDVDVSEHSGARLRRIRALTDTDSEVNQTGKPSGYEFRYGLVEYDVEGVAAGSTVRVKLNFREPIPDGSKVYQVTSSGYTEIPDATIDGNIVTVTLTDGGAGDRDEMLNGVISDPVGIASPTAAAPEASSGCSVAGGGDPTDFSGVYGALMFAGMLFLLRGRAKGKASVK